MGLAASQARFLMLTARKSDLQMQGQAIHQARMALSNMMSQLINGQANLTPDNPAMIQLQKRIEAIQQIDKRLELMLKRLETQEEEVKTEVDVTKRLIDDNIKNTFKTFG